MATSFPSYLRGQVLRERSQEQLEECVRARIGPGGAEALRTAPQYKAPGSGNSEMQGSREAGTSDIQHTLDWVASVSLGSDTYTQVHLPRGGCFQVKGTHPQQLFSRTNFYFVRQVCRDGGGFYKSLSFNTSKGPETPGLRLH